MTCNQFGPKQFGGRGLSFWLRNACQVQHNIHNIHAIHRRLQELYNSNPPPPPYSSSSSALPQQIDVKEFVQLKPDSTTTLEETDEMDSEGTIGLHPSDDLNWDTLLMEDGRWQLDDDVQQKAGYPISIWDL